MSIFNKEVTDALQAIAGRAVAVLLFSAAYVLFWGFLFSMALSIFFADWGMFWLPNIPDIARGFIGLLSFSSVLITVYVLEKKA